MKTLFFKTIFFYKSKNLTHYQIYKKTQIINLI